VRDISRSFFIKETYLPRFLDKLHELRKKRGFIERGRTARGTLFSVVAREHHKNRWCTNAQSI
jgi:hypothetical protein